MLCKLIIAALAAATVLSPPCLAADLSATESRWLKGAWPVIAFAKEAGLPLDIVVQPQPTPGNAPLGMAYVGGRCKLVLSMRGNPEAETALARIPPDLQDAALELMAAHELGHCRRYLDGVWFRTPAGFSSTATPPAELSPDLRTAYDEMRATRREEGYGDLVGLAWASRHRPHQYAALHAWLLQERSTDRVPGSHHDTLAWLRLAGDPARLTGVSLFSGVDGVWTAGLKQPD